MSSYPLRMKLVDIARGEIGTVESPANSNSGPRVRGYQLATNLGGTGWPWCAAFVCWCIREWGRFPEVRAALVAAGHPVRTDAQFEKWRPKTAAAFGFHTWAIDRDLMIFDDSGKQALHTGDIMTFDMSHIGIVITDSGKMIETVEGNTNSAGGREGGGVFQKTRRLDEARRFIRILS